MGFYQGKKVLVTGGTGMIGRQLVPMLLSAGAQVCVASLDQPVDFQDDVEFQQKDLRNFDHCMTLCQGKDMVFHLAGIKGSPKAALHQPASFFVPTITFNTNVMEAAMRCSVDHFLYTSSIGVYAPSSLFKEDDVWSTFPSANDRFAGWAKRMGELQAEAYRIQYGMENISIVRPANVYGPFDNFNDANAMVIPSLIKKAFNAVDTIEVWGDGSAVRDFIHSRDVARGMMIAVEKGINEPINLGSGKGCSIKEIVDVILSSLPDGKQLTVSWDTSKPSGDKIRLMDMVRAKSYGIHLATSIEEGVSEVIRWYDKHLMNGNMQSYNAFTEELT